MDAHLEKLLTVAAALGVEDQVTLLAFAEFLAARQGATPHCSNDGAIKRPQKTRCALPDGATTAHEVAPNIEPAQASDEAGRSDRQATTEAESVVAAIKRLTANNPHIERAPLLGDTAALVERFITGASSRTDTIAELEKLFAVRGRNAAGESEGGSAPSGGGSASC